MQSIGSGAILAVVAVAFIGTAGVATAHETTTVNGYELTFGGSDEPVITGERMWLQVEILDADTGAPVEGIDDSVEIAVQRPFGNDTRELETFSVFGSPGWYEGAVVFTEPGTYTVFITAEVEGATIETSFQKQVHNASSLQYPQPTPSSERDSGMDASMGFGLGAIVAAIGMTGAFYVGRRRQ